MINRCKIKGAMIEQNLGIERRIEKERIDQLYNRSKSASLALFVGCSIYTLFLIQKFPWQPLMVWYGVFLSVLIGRWLLSRYYAKTKNNNRSLSFWLYFFRISIFVTGLTIGSLNLFFFPHEPLSYLLLSIFIPCGITAGAVTVLVDFFSFFLYVITLMVPVVFQTAVFGDQTYIGTGMLSLILILFFLKFSKGYNDNFNFTMRLRYENRNLVEELQHEKNTLDNRLGRILNDSSIEIFVADADSFRCLQVNKGAIENLGYSENEFENINLTEIFTELDRNAFRQLLSPLYNGRREIVLHNGYNLRKDGSIYPVEARFQLSTSDDPPIVVVSVQDITERREWEKKLIYQANYDQLTGLYNRHYIQSYMHSVFARARRQKQKVALLFMDLDNFKNINDSLGHAIGDEVLKQTADRIQTALRETDTPARTGGDEFTVLVEGLNKNIDAEVVASRLVEIFKQPFLINNKEVYTTASLGISIYPDDSKFLDQLMQYADIAMYQAKEDGRNSHRFFSREMRRISVEQMIIANHLRYALERNEFSLVYQPKIKINSGQIIGAEALLRWHNQKTGDVSPVTFIPLAENMGLINEIGRWVLDAACREAKVWQQLTANKVQISVNVSPQQFRSSSLLMDVENALENSGLKHDHLELEITESLLLLDSDHHISILNTLNDKGVSLALDDFGTGFSSLSYLRRFPLQVLKIDRSFINDLNENGSSKVLVEAIIAMAKSLKLDIVAEGVEDEKQLEFLRQQGVSIVQGYFFSPPVPAKKFRTLLQEGFDEQ